MAKKASIVVKQDSFESGFKHGGEYICADAIASPPLHSKDGAVVKLLVSILRGRVSTQASAKDNERLEGHEWELPEFQAGPREEPLQLLLRFLHECFPNYEIRIE